MHHDSLPATLSADCHVPHDSIIDADCRIQAHPKRPESRDAVASMPLRQMVPMHGLGPRSSRRLLDTEVEMDPKGRQDSQLFQGESAACGKIELVASVMFSIAARYFRS
jgi:hypothetical protein